MRRLRNLWPARVEQASDTRLARILAGDDERLRVRAARTLGARGRCDGLPELLDDGVPGLRTVAARALGRDGLAAPALAARLAVEGCWTVRVALALALERQGRSVPLEPETVATDEGERVPERALGLGLGDFSSERALVRPELSAHQHRSSLDLALPGQLEVLGALGLDDHDRLMELRPSLGRREVKSWLLALGRSADPRAAGPLLRALEGLGVDPGRGFAERRLAALGLGRLGLPSLGPRLRRAFHVEKAEEGRPGAGLGIQYPVRAVLVWALGECGDRDSIPLLQGLLDDRSGTPLGGLHLPARGALLKLEA